MAGATSAICKLNKHTLVEQHDSGNFRKAFPSAWNFLWQRGIRKSRTGMNYERKILYNRATISKTNIVFLPAKEILNLEAKWGTRSLCNWFCFGINALVKGSCIMPEILFKARLEYFNFILHAGYFLLFRAISIEAIPKQTSYCNLF